MPKPIDLTGRRFGKLIVIGRGEPEISASGKTRYATWRVVCDCGAEEVLRDIRIPHCATNIARRDAAEACVACRSQRSCAVCSRPFNSVRLQAVCSEACHVIHRRRIDMDAYYRRVERDPEVNKRKGAKIRAAAEVDAVLAKKLREQERARYYRHAERMRTDPEYAEAQRAAQRQAYASRAEEIQAARRAKRAENADIQQRMRDWAKAYWQSHAQEILAQRRRREAEKVAAMSVEERQAYRAARREQQRLYAASERADPAKRQRRNEISDAARERSFARMTPAELAAWIDRRRESERRRRESESFRERARINSAAWRQRRALNKLMGTADALAARLEQLNTTGDDDDDDAGDDTAN